MKDIRIGNDIIVSWSIFAEGAPYSLEGKEVTLYLCSQFGKRRAEGYAITGNQITWTFFGKEQKHSGKYSLELVVNEDAEGMVTTDACDFVNLVNCTCKVGGADDAGVQTESVELSSDLGFIAYDDTKIREELAKKVDADKIATINGLSLVNGGNIVIEGGEGGGYDDTQIVAKLDELSAEVGRVSEDVANKQDKISDLDSIRSGASKGATAIQEVKTINGQSIVGSGNITIEGGSGGGGGTDAELREAIFGKTTSKEFAINGYHAPTADTLAVDIKQGEVFRLRLDSLGAEISKFTFWVKYAGDASQTNLLNHTMGKDFFFYAQKDIVEIGVSASSTFVITKGNVRLSVIQGGITEPRNYMELGNITLVENTSELNVLDYIPSILKFKKIIIRAVFIYSSDRAKKGSIKLEEENAQSITIENLFSSATQVCYIFDLTLDENRIDAYIECHSNSIDGVQITDGNQGKNFGKTRIGNAINTFIINLPLLAGDKLTFYGK